MLPVALDHWRLGLTPAAPDDLTPGRHDGELDLVATCQRDGSRATGTHDDQSPGGASSALASISGIGGLAQSLR
jgi:hypothetical protein